jgi:NADH-quinone oxidoreductase subunit C
MTMASRLGKLLEDWEIVPHVFRGQMQVNVVADQLLERMQQLREKADMDMLMDITAADLLEYGEDNRFRVVYQLLDTDSGQRIEVRTHVNDPQPTLPTMFNLWRAADWLEREVYDMFGIVFSGHPNLKRLLLPEEFQSFPLRKDYPVKGRGERHNFPVITRAES